MMKLYVVTVVSSYTRETRHGSGIWETVPTRDHNAFWALKDGSRPAAMAEYVRRHERSGASVVVHELEVQPT